MLILLSPPENELEENNIWVGSSDTKLSEKGRAEASNFAQTDTWVNPDRFYIAPTKHILEFCSIILPSKNPTCLSGLIDRSMGNLQGRGYRETMVEFPRRNWLGWQRSYWTAPPEGESLFDISDRVLTTFRTKVLPIDLRETVLLIIGPDVMKLLIGYLSKIEEIDIPKISVESMIPYVINGVVE